jgi:magnesium transporter
MNSSKQPRNRPFPRSLLRASETAERRLDSSVPTGAASDLVQSVLNRLRGTPYHSVEAVYVLDAEKRLLGIVALANLLQAEPAKSLHEIMSPPAVEAQANDDQEFVASLALHHEIAEIPIVDAERRFLGVISSRQLMRILRHEHVEDLHRLAGIRAETQQARHCLEEPPVRRAKDRLPWLLLGLLGSVAATAVMAGFESALNRRIEIAFFIPGLVYLADAIGTQTEAIAVRGLSLSHAPLSRLLMGEVRTGLLIGLTLAAAVLPATWLGFHDVRLAISIALAVFFAGAISTAVGLLLPWALSRLRQDPAFGSGPVATVIQDVLSLLIYLTVVSLLKP